MSYRYDKEYLKKEVERLNEKYCKRTKNKMMVQGAYNGVRVELVPKWNERGMKPLKGSMAGAAPVTSGFVSAKEALFELYKNDSRGYVKELVNRYKKGD